MEEQNKEQPIAEVTVELDREAHRRFGRFAMLHWPQNIVLLIFIAIMPPMLAFIFFFAVRLQREILLVMATTLTVMYLAMLAHMATHRGRAFHKLEKMGLQPETFAFNEGHVLVRGGTNLTQVSQQMQYELFGTVYETAYAFYLVLRVPKNNTFVLEKKFFDEGQAVALRELFARKFEKKFKQYNRNRGPTP